MCLHVLTAFSFLKDPDDHWDDRILYFEVKIDIVDGILDIFFCVCVCV